MLVIRQEVPGVGELGLPECGDTALVVVLIVDVLLEHAPLDPPLADPADADRGQLRALHESHSDIHRDVEDLTDLGEGQEAAD